MVESFSFFLLILVPKDRKFQKEMAFSLDVISLVILCGKL